MSWFKKRDRSGKVTEFRQITALPIDPPPLKPQQLGPNQLKWLEERFKFYGIHRKQAEAPTGVAVVQSSAWASEDRVP